MTPDRLAELMALERAVHVAIDHIKTDGMMVTMSDKERRKWEEEFGEFDFVIGNFAVVNLNKRPL